MAAPRGAGLNDETGLYEWQPKGLRVFQVTAAAFAKYKYYRDMTWVVRDP